ncbi:TatD family hydrolase [Mycobacterium lacus]|uniref:TatD family hydrolase n=2 Tax=Mycobacterium lacus TaxID=169765 RepID=A0A1X1Y720_9MYCO|nr:TatD family hydrolase [Mycobacterium lacus]MCV7125633.1 TatD family hydrolase [Mycobacterium lacus]ORW06801.1 hydrolase TatD [Mycobacterium lacus]BBX96306.1 TatD family hydrolase [Mycobacterium lacus]
MRIFDPHIHMTSRTTDDYENMYAAGVRAIVEPAFWLGQPRTDAASFIDYFDSLIGWERYRASQFGIAHNCTIALNPKEANDSRCRPVLEQIPRYLSKSGVVAVGEIGYDSMTSDETAVFETQLEMAAKRGMPALVHTPHRDKLGGTLASIEVVKRVGIDPALVLLDHLNEVTIEPALESGCWAGFSIYPDTKMDEGRMVALMQRYGLERIIVNSAADWGRSDPLKTAKTAQAMLAASFTEDDVDRVMWRNPVEFYGQSGQLRLLSDDQDAAFAGNTINRGERP